MTLQDGIESRGEKNGEAGTCKMTSRPIKTSKPNHAPQEWTSDDSLTEDIQRNILLHFHKT